MRYYPLSSAKDYLEAIDGIMADVEDKTILDVGSGNGELARLLTEKGYSVETLDPELGDPTYRCKAQDFGFPKSYGLVMAMYDVLNYLNPEEYESFCELAEENSEVFIYEIWPDGGVKLLKWNNGHLRIAVRIFDVAHVFFIGRSSSYHKMYLHED